MNWENGWPGIVSKPVAFTVAPACSPLGMVRLWRSSDAVRIRSRLIGRQVEPVRLLWRGLDSDGIELRVRRRPIRQLQAVALNRASES